MISTAEFLEKNRDKGVPLKFLNKPVFTFRERQEYIKWLLAAENPFIKTIHFGTMRQLLYYPSVAEVGEKYHIYPADAWIDGREKVSMTDEWLHYPYLYFPDGCDDQGRNRSLANVHMPIAYAEKSHYLAHESLLRNFVHFTPEIMELAAEGIQQLGMFQYASFHIRRGDFQYHESKSGSDKSYDNVRPLLRDGEPVYIATDESKPGFFHAFEAKHKVWFLKDLHVFKRIPRKLIGMVESVICAAGREFVGTRHSTFTQYIHRLRAYMGAPSRMLYYHTIKYTGNPKIDIKKRPSQVASSYKEEFDIAWEHVDFPELRTKFETHWLPV